MLEILLVGWFGIPNILLGILYGVGIGLIVSRVKKSTITNTFFAFLVFSVATFVLTNSYLNAAQLSFWEAFNQITKSQFARDAVASFMLGLGTIIGFSAFIGYWQISHKIQPQDSSAIS